LGKNMARIETIRSNDVETRVRQAQGPVVLDFYQASCAPCRTLEPRLERVAEDYAAKVPVYRVDIDRDLEVAKSFHVMSLPTILVVKAGREVIRLDGLIKDQDLRAAFEQALA
jgi:thioredoxin 1